MNNNIKYKDKTVFFNTQPVVFNFPIGNIIEYENFIIIRLDIPLENNTRKNIFALDYDAKYLWQIQAIAEYNSALQESIYTNIEILPDKNILATATNGNQYKIDYKTGKFISSAKQ